MLVVFAGLPASGKTTLARALAGRLGAAFLRVDEVEAAMWRAGVGRDQPTGIAAYVVAEAVAEASLRAGATVVVDAVNPVEEARRAWRELARRTGRPLRVVEVTCADPAEHRRRVEERRSDVPGWVLPTWAEVLARDYEPWAEERLVVDAAATSPAECLARIEMYVVAGAP